MAAWGRTLEPASKGVWGCTPGSRPGSPLSATLLRRGTDDAGASGRACAPVRFCASARCAGAAAAPDVPSFASCERNSSCQPVKTFQQRCF